MTRKFQIAGLQVVIEGSFPREDVLFALYEPYRSDRRGLDVTVTLGALPEPTNPPAIRIRDGWLSIAEDGARLRVGGEVTPYDVDRLLMHGLSVALAETGGLIVHGAAVDGPSGGLAFVGPSGAGKTTAALNCPAPLLQPDRIALGAGPRGGVWLTPLPFVYGEPRSGSVSARPLSRLLFVEQACSNAIRIPSHAEALSRLLACTLMPPSTRRGAERVLEIAGGIVAAGVSAVLSARHDGGFWSLIAPSPETIAAGEEPRVTCPT